MSSHYLFTFLGRVPLDQNSGGYRKSTYQFPDGLQKTTSFSGIAIEEWQQPDQVVVLGTTGSMWHVLLELTDTYDQAPELWEDLERSHSNDEVTQSQLDALSEHLSRARDRRWVARLIPYGRDRKEQAEILRTLAAEVPQRTQVTLDVTHGFRHLPMVMLVAALQLKELHEAKITGFYYGAFEMATGGTAPFLELDGLLEAAEWLQALHTYTKDGDYGAFADLYRREGVGESTVGRLEQAAFFERTTNPTLASKQLSTLHSSSPNLETPIGGLFSKELWRRIQWFRSPSRAERERSLAHIYLKRRDYVRAIVFAQEGYISRHLERRGEDLHSYERRDEARNRIKSDNFQKLRRVRNAVAHGDRPKSPEARKALESEANLRKYLEEIFAVLLDDQGAW
ncbi:TIGR02221 family CRISPR-associated protein [Halorhodospira halochloris]|uniref:TIGR02221 family CRISPR-associated protein n=1 Tax=Halorhodospira halochloris TaxID=1052 RepID=UPI001EE8A341|nr:TIGR02221 family CRISPR-associated protein [Halorhodospira halochloris]MCG5531166.1 TIGR02221 family CRISPR-associated protein [Halorhodospira halochloris]